ncbi:protein SENESCENCE-ASSOCIATED GENE 21, mitochondrial-like [Zingiber officinale]|uniref:protein SENESCENCE-ASSOCIATED GENE 21, mitochondrial-like n=1 Tax=Zingiber officinale TaxID=94328 RepID=UPI001C4B4BF0|nr:protein SENESCENCE-ASSOCIATED GENE 21, mitochondrial-like [Zingiber officinale]
MSQALRVQQIAMARISINPAASTVLSLRRRAFAVVAAEERRAPATGGAMEGRVTSAAAEKVYWMKDPKTGNWMPEDRFGDVDVAEQRARLLSCWPAGRASN